VKGKKMKIAIPITEEQVLSAHFALCDMFAIFHVENGELKHKDYFNPPPHRPGSIPRWLKEKAVDVVIAAGIGQKAIDFFEKERIEVIYGVESNAPEELISQYIAGTLNSGSNICDRISP
jgi:predicted Fe-Mo cluster-binding NifX family protein